MNKKILTEEQKMHEKERLHEWYLKNREKVLKKQKDYYKKHSESIKEYEKKYFYTPIGRAQRQFQQYRRMDKRNGFGNVIDFDARWIVENIYTKKCAHCDETDWRKLGCNRLDNSKPHTIDNVEPCCGKCNRKKWYEEYKQVYQYTNDKELIAIYPNVHQASKETKISDSGIYLCCKGGFFDKKKNKWININQAGGFIWSLTPLT